MCPNWCTYNIPKPICLHPVANFFYLLFITNSLRIYVFWIFSSCVLPSSVRIRTVWGEHRDLHDSYQLFGHFLCEIKEQETTAHVPCCYLRNNWCLMTCMLIIVWEWMSMEITWRNFRTLAFGHARTHRGRNICMCFFWRACLVRSRYDISCAKKHGEIEWRLKHFFNGYCV